MVKSALPVPLKNHPPSPARQALINDLRRELEQGHADMSSAADQIKKCRYWNMGKRIKRDILENADRADYGATLYVDLEKDLSVGARTLYCCVQFYESYPQILHAAGSELTWTHYRTLLTIPDIAERKKYEKKIIDKHLDSRALIALIRKDKGLPESETRPLPVTRDTPYVYRLETVRGRERIDLGFNFYEWDPDPALVSTVKGNALRDNAPQGEPHYTYKAIVLGIVDGDTIWVEIDLGLNRCTEQKLRLRGINAAEIATPEGKAARDYIEKQLKGCPFIAVKTYWRDKFTRYLTDVFYDKKETDLQRLIQNGNFLNQELLDKNYAVRY